MYVPRTFTLFALIVIVGMLDRSPFRMIVGMLDLSLFRVTFSLFKYLRIFPTYQTNKRKN